MLFRRVLFCCIMAAREATGINARRGKKAMDIIMHVQEITLHVQQQAVFLDTATLYLQRIMQLIAGGFLIFVECVSVDVQRCRDLRVTEEA